MVGWQGWQSIFFVNLLIGVPALLVARRLLKQDSENGGQAGPLPDWLGAILLMGAVGGLALALIEGPEWGWGSRRVLGTIAVSVICLVGFLRRSTRHPAPVFELALFRIRSFAVANAALFVFSIGFFSLLPANVLFLTSTWHYSALKAGLALTPGPLTAAAVAPIAGRLADRFGARVVAVPAGLLFAMAAGLFALTVTVETAYASRFLPALMLAGAGVGLSFAALGSAAVADLPRTRFATGAAIATCFRQIGAVVGIAALFAILGASGRVQPLSSFQRGWALMAATGVVTSGLSLLIGMTRAADSSQMTPHENGQRK